MEKTIEYRPVIEIGRHGCEVFLVEEKTMKIQCPLCGGETVRKRIDYGYRKDDEYVIIKNVPAYVCRDCGGDFFDSSVVKKLLSGSLLDRGKEVGCLKKIEVEYPE